MTQLLTLLAQDFVMQASDRLLTYPDGSPADEDANKAVMWDLGTVFTYSGWATVPPDERKTYMWLADLLQPLDMSGDGLMEIAREASAAFGDMTRQGFSGISWTTHHHDKLWPTGIMISNAYGTDGWLPTPQSEFMVRIRLLPPTQPFEVGAFPPLHADEHHYLVTQLEYLHEQTAAPDDYATALIECIRRLADRNERVGKSVLINCYPKNAIESDRTIVAEQPNLETRSFLHVPAGSTSRFQLAPVYVDSRIQLIDIHLDVPPGTSLIEFAHSEDPPANDEAPEADGGEALP